MPLNEISFLSIDDAVKLSEQQALQAIEDRPAIPMEVNPRNFTQLTTEIYECPALSIDRQAFGSRHRVSDAAFFPFAIEVMVTLNVRFSRSRES